MDKGFRKNESVLRALFWHKKFRKIYQSQNEVPILFFSFPTGGRIELITKPFLSDRSVDTLGYAHLALAVGTKEDVDSFAERFIADGYPLLSGPRTTGDGYYEAVIQDPEGNFIELTAG